MTPESIRALALAIYLDPRLRIGTMLDMPPPAENVIAEVITKFMQEKNGDDYHAERELLDWAESLICNAIPMSHCTQPEWDEAVKKWRDAKHGVTEQDPVPSTLEKLDFEPVSTS